jgi:hypothetical protein
MARPSGTRANYFRRALSVVAVPDVAHPESGDCAGFFDAVELGTVIGDQSVIARSPQQSCHGSGHQEKSRGFAGSAHRVRHWHDHLPAVHDRWLVGGGTDIPTRRRRAMPMYSSTFPSSPVTDNYLRAGRIIEPAETDQAARPPH